MTVCNASNSAVLFLAFNAIAGSLTTGKSGKFEFIIASLASNTNCLFSAALFSCSDPNTLPSRALTRLTVTSASIRPARSRREVCSADGMAMSEEGQERKCAGWRVKAREGSKGRG